MALRPRLSEVRWKEMGLLMQVGLLPATLGRFTQPFTRKEMGLLTQGRALPFFLPSAHRSNFLSFFVFFSVQDAWAGDPLLRPCAEEMIRALETMKGRPRYSPGSEVRGAASHTPSPRPLHSLPFILFPPTTQHPIHPTNPESKILKPHTYSISLPPQPPNPKQET